MAASATTACPTSGTNGKLYWKGTGSDPLAESDLAGNPLEEYIFFNGGRIARRDVSSTGRRSRCTTIFPIIWARTESSRTPPEPKASRQPQPHQDVDDFLEDAAKKIRDSGQFR